MTEYWFARRFPVGNPRSTMAPVTWQGWAVALGFIAGMVIGAVAFALLAMAGLFITGAIAYVVLALLSGGLFVAAVSAKGDRTRTVEDYRKDRRA